MVEIWKDVKGYESIYQVSNLGNVRSLDRIVNSRWGTPKQKKGKLMALSTNKYGYHFVGLFDKYVRSKCVTVHRLVAIAFIENPNEYPMVNHKDGIKNNNKVDNLEWCNLSQNVLHSYRVLGQKPNKTNTGNTEHKSKVAKPILQIDSNSGQVINRFTCARAAMRITGISFSNISAAKMHNGTAGGYKWADA